MDGMTGFNPEVANADYERVASLLSLSRQVLVNDVFSIISVELSHIWASPNAVEFGSTYQPRIRGVEDSFGKKANAICHNIADAIDIMAAANGFPSFLKYDVEDLPTNAQELLDGSNSFDDNKNGEVGMNVLLVKKTIEAFKTQASSFYERLDELDLSTIALYDPDGSMQAAFKELLASFKTEMQELVSDIVTAIESAMETETNNIMVAKDSAANTMSA